MIVVTFTACDEKKNRIILLSSMTMDDNHKVKFEYDDQNRIVKMIHYTNNNEEPSETQTLTYDNEGGIEITNEIEDFANAKFTRDGDTITTSDMNNSYVITVSNDDFIVKIDSIWLYDPPEQKFFHYLDDNLIKTDGNGGNDEYKNDSYKTPFANCNTPKWFLQYHFGDWGINNIIETKPEKEAPRITEFEYDKQEFPVKRTVTLWSGNKSVTEYSYNNG